MSTIRPQSSGIGKSHHHHHGHSRTARPGFISDSKNGGVEKVNMYFFEDGGHFASNFVGDIPNKWQNPHVAPLLISVLVTSAVLKSTGCSFDWDVWGGVFIGTLTVDDWVFTVDVVLCVPPVYRDLIRIQDTMGCQNGLKPQCQNWRKKHQAKLPIRLAETNMSPKEMPSPQSNKSLPTSSNHQSSSISRCNLLVEGKLTISIHLNLGGRQHQHGFSHQVQHGSLASAGKASNKHGATRLGGCSASLGWDEKIPFEPSTYRTHNDWVTIMSPSCKCTQKTHVIHLMHED